MWFGPTVFAVPKQVPRVVFDACYSFEFQVGQPGDGGYEQGQSTCREAPVDDVSALVIQP